MTSSQERISPATHPTDFSSPEPFTQKHRGGSTSKTWTNISYFWSTWATNCKAGECSWRTFWSPPQKSFGFGIFTALWEGRHGPLRDPCSHHAARASGTGCGTAAAPEIPRNSSSAGDTGWEKQRERQQVLLLFPWDPRHFSLGHACRIWEMLIFNPRQNILFGLSYVILLCGPRGRNLKCAK